MTYVIPFTEKIELSRPIHQTYTESTNIYRCLPHTGLLPGTQDRQNSTLLSKSHSNAERGDKQAKSVRSSKMQNEERKGRIEFYTGWSEGLSWCWNWAETWRQKGRSWKTRGKKSRSGGVKGSYVEVSAVITVTVPQRTHILVFGA